MNPGAVEAVAVHPTDPNKVSVIAQTEKHFLGWGAFSINNYSRDTIRGLRLHRLSVSCFRDAGSVG